MFNKIIKIVFIVLVLLAIGISYYLYSLIPNFKGEINIQNLQDKVEVYYDDYGIPHIYAQNDLDAMTALGYVHAQDRLWQMEVVRRIAAGRLSEIFGEEFIEVDKFFLNLGIDQNSKETVAKIDKNTIAYKQTIAYLNGVNDYVNNGKTPVEFTVIGVEKTEFNIEDVYNVFGYMGYGFAMGNQTDPLITALKEKLGSDYIKQLDLVIDTNSQLIQTSPKQQISEETAVSLSQITQTVFDKASIPPFVGSNSWVLAPEKTKNNKVIFANDPHIGYSQPAVWYQAHITTPTTEIYGFYLALTPFPLLGHNHDMAYGLTMFENDDIDLYLEKNNPENPNEYFDNGTYKKYKIRETTIKIKGGKTVKHIIKETQDGRPIINEVVPQVKTKSPVSMHWVYTHRPNKLLDATYTISRSKNITESRHGASLIHAPGLNVMYGDAKGNIAWWASAALYKRANNAPTKLLLDGTNPENTTIEYTPFNENPQAENPNLNYVYSCNNQPDSIVSKRYIPGYYIAEDRAKRVVELVESKDNWTEKEVMQMIVDNTSSVVPDLVKSIVSKIEDKQLTHVEKQALLQLKNWDGTATLTSTGTTIYTRFQYEFLKETLEDEMGKEIYEGLRKTHFMGRMMAPLVEGKYPIWTDNIQTTDIEETDADIMLLAFQKTISALTDNLGDNPTNWVWSEVHILEHKHPLGEVALFKPFFNVGPFPVSGTNEVLNNQMFSLTDEDQYEIHGGPSSRRVIDFSDVENAKAIIPTGQSGNVMSPHYKDQTELFNKGEFIPMLLNKDVIQGFENKLVLIKK